jgi:hypothetical protein
MTVAAFGVTFSHCDRIANYLARYAADRDADVDRAVMRLSAVFNEVLEAFYRHGSRGAQLLLDLERTANRIILQVRTRGTEENRRFLRTVEDLAGKPGARAWYQDQLAQGAPEVEASVLALVDVLTSSQGTLELSSAANTSTVQITTSLDTTEATS